MRKARRLLFCLCLLIVGPLPVAHGVQDVRSVTPLPAVTDSDDRFGIGNVYPEPHWFNLARTAGMRWNRWEFRWSAIEARAGRWEWAGSDQVVDANQAAGLQIEGILISTPRWAEVRQAGGVIPSGLYEAWDSPRNTWGTFVRTIAERYRGRVQAWEIWNEPDYPPGSFGFWFASKADYYQLLKVAYQAVKAVDPAAQVLVAGLMYWGDPAFLEDLLRLGQEDPEAAANRFFFDGIAWHVYSRPTDVFDRVQRSRLLLQKYVGQKTIWVNEGNLPVWSESPMNDYQRFPLSGTLEEQAAWVVQWYAYALAAGADRVLMYRMHDSDEPEAWGLARSDGSIRPAYVAYQLAARYFGHATSAARAPLGEAEQIVFLRPGQRVTVVWNRTQHAIPPLAVGAAALAALLVDLDGSSQRIAPSGGTYALSLPAATANTGMHADDYLVGGRPFILIEDLLTAGEVVEETDGRLAWSGSWDPEPQPAATAGRAVGSAQAGATVSFAFRGSSFTWYTSKSPRAGIARLLLDGNLLADVDLYNPAPIAQFPLTFTGLGPGPHLVSISVTGTRDPSSLASYVVVDAFAAEQPLAAPPLPSPNTASPSGPPGANPRSVGAPAAGDTATPSTGVSR
jgi:Glycosyl hydrolase family 10